MITRNISQKQLQVGILYICSVMGMLFGALASIVNTRFLIPASYGDVRFVQNFANVGATILYFGYFISGGRLLALWKDESEKRNLRGTMMLVLGRSALMLFAFMIACSFCYSNNSNLSTLFVLSLPLCLHLLFNNYIFNVAQGENRIGLLAVTQLCPYAIYVFVAYFVYDTYGATSERMMFLQGVLYMLVTLCVAILTHFTFKDVKRCYQKLKDENKNYGNQVYYGSLAMTASTYLAGISIGLFGENNIEVGFFSLAVTVSTPMSMLPTIIGITFFKDFATLSVIPSKVLKGTVAMTMVSCLLFVMLIKPLVIFLYSQEYAVVGNYAILLAVGFAIHGLGDLFSKFLLSHGQGRQVRNSSIICGLAKISGYIVVVSLFGVYGAIATTIIADLLYSGNMIRGYSGYLKTQASEL